MKVSSLSASTVEAGLLQQYEAESVLEQKNGKQFSLLKQLDRIGTSIALGESGDLDAAHEFRSKNAGM